MSKKDKIELSREKKEDMIISIKEFFWQERDEELGDLAASMVLNFIMEEIAPEFYNQGIYDSKRYMEDRLDDLLSIQKF